MIHLKKVMYLWLSTIFILIILIVSFLLYQENYGRITFSKEHVVGSYQIDTTFYPGKNADWQNEIYRFDITANDKFILYEKLKDGTERKYINNIKWNYGPPFHWSLNIINDHHVIDPRPQLHRSLNNRKFYYVFESERFGNMFFRKVKGS